MATVLVMSNWLMWALVCVGFPFSLYMFSEPPMVLSWHFMSYNAISVDFPIAVDGTSLLFGCTVMFIACNIVQFSSVYMSEDPFLERFISILGLFVIAMKSMVFVPSMLFVLWGWDGLGVSSFVLVSYYQSPKALAAGYLTVFINRVGDVFILLGIARSLGLPSFGLSQCQCFGGVEELVNVCVMIAAMTKSAQIPFSSWLPAAMAAPTPVSALVHSSTLVTAGVYLLIRFNMYIEVSSSVAGVLGCVSLLTAMMAGMVATLETDLKKVIALSTLSQLGLMVYSFSLDLLVVTFCHLIIHAMFKALMFLSAGVLIMNAGHSQDLRVVSNSALHVPFSSVALLISNMTLAAVPYSASYYSKDSVLELSFSSNLAWFFFPLLSLATLFSSAYAFRLTLSLMSPVEGGSSVVVMRESVSNLLKPLAVLLFMSIVVGVGVWWVVLQPLQEVMMSLGEKVLLVFFPLFGGYWMWCFIEHIPSAEYEELVLSMWFFVPLSSQALGDIFFPASINFTHYMETGLMERMLPLLVKGVSAICGSAIMKVQFMSAREYFVIMCITVFIFGLMVG